MLNTDLLYIHLIGPVWYSQCFCLMGLEKKYAEGKYYCLVKKILIIQNNWPINFSYPSEASCQVIGTVKWKCSLGKGCICRKWYLKCIHFSIVMVICVWVHSSMQTESDLGCPGGKARIIHKESDIITAFAINKVQLSYTNFT